MNFYHTYIDEDLSVIVVLEPLVGHLHASIINVQVCENL